MINVLLSKKVLPILLLLFLASCNSITIDNESSTQIQFPYEVEFAYVYRNMDDLDFAITDDSFEVEYFIEEDYSHPFANILSMFLTDLAPRPDFEPFIEQPDWRPRLYPYSSHAILVYLNDNSTQGMLVSKLSADIDKYAPEAVHLNPASVFVQRLFVLYNNEITVIVPEWNWPDIGVTAEGRFIFMPRANGGGDTVRAYTLVEFIDGTLTPFKSLWVHERWIRGEGVYFPFIYARKFGFNYHSGNFWERNREQDFLLTYEEFDALMIKYRLHDLYKNIWDLPDETDAILLLTAN